jgi:Uma2 family endonuclease
MSTQVKRLLTPQEYLAIERDSEFRHEFYRGEMLQTTGGSFKHSLIKSYISRALGNQLKSRDCTVHSSDLRVKVTATGIYTYPDVLVACGELQLEDAHSDTLLNPVVIVEVLSPSTEAYDRGEKWKNYRTIDSLREYLLVAQDAPRVEQYIRQEQEGWLLTETDQLDQTVELPSIACRLPLREIYARVDFEAAEKSDTSRPS